MKELFGSPGRLSGLMLRTGQCLFAATSIVFMLYAPGFYNSTAFCYLIASMGLQVLWSFGLACLDLHAFRSKKNLQNPVLMSLFVVGDWAEAAAMSLPLLSFLFIRFEMEKQQKLSGAAYVPSVMPKVITATLSLAGACSAAGVVVLYARDFKKDFCKSSPHFACSRFQISVVLAFISWFFLAISSQVMFCLLAAI